MAEVFSRQTIKTLPPTPPPPVYSSTPTRSLSPRLSSPPPETDYLSYAPVRQTVKAVPLRPSISMIPVDTFEPEFTYVRQGAEVQIHPPGLADHENGMSNPSHSAYGYQSPQDPNKLTATTSNITRRKPLGERENNVPEDIRRRVSSDNLSSRDASVDRKAQRNTTRYASAPLITQDVPVENFQPLQYYHQDLEDTELAALAQKTSYLAIGDQQDRNIWPHNGTGVDETGMGIGNQHLQRPDSGFSSTSDVRVRARSPQHSPALPISRQTRSPDVRPMSYIDLLNVPYPQQAPHATENLVNAQLRTAVGANASLLSTKKTLEMYRANVKKTTDPAIQYEFAVFMVGAAQDDTLDLEDGSDSERIERASLAMRDDLLKEAKHILQKLCDRSYPFAQYYLADGFASGLFNRGREDWDRAFPLFLAASKHGHAEAGYRTALCYEFGWGCRVDAAKAVQFYQHAASKNHPGAMLRLGRACLTGDMGLIKRYREGVRWLKRAAESADFQYNQAPYDLGQLHETGFGPDVFKDETYAAQLYTQAADLGHIEASYRLGDAYENGRLGCPKDAALSIHFYTGAAEQGHALSQMALCAWYMIGVENVLEKDESEAYEWARQAAESGLAKAQYTVGWFTEMGIGCRRDPLEANMWYVKAADQGDDRAKHRLAAISRAGTGQNPTTAALGKNSKTPVSDGGEGSGSEKKKRFGLF